MEVSETENREAVLSFLEAQYFPYSWTMESMSLHRVLAISDGDEVVGYVWYNERSVGVLEIHVCVKASYAGRWITRSLLQRLYSIGVSIGAHSVVGLIDRPAIARIYKRLGATIAGPFAILPIKDLSNGPLQRT